MYLSRICAAGGWFLSGRTRSSTSEFGASYQLSSITEVAGVWRPWWHVQQLTFCAPPKFARLIVATMSTILRAMTFGGVSITQFTLSVPAFGWQSAQSYPSAAEMTPIDWMKSSTLRSFSEVAVTFLKNSPAFWPGIGAGIWVCADGRRTAN